MTSMPYTGPGGGGGPASPETGGGREARPEVRGDKAERQARWRQSAERARKRIRTADGKDGNGLRDAARQISATARERMGAVRPAVEPSGGGNRERASGSIAGRAAAAEENRRVAGSPTDNASTMARDKVERVKGAMAVAGAKDNRVVSRPL